MLNIDNLWTHLHCHNVWDLHDMLEGMARDSVTLAKLPIRVTAYVGPSMKLVSTTVPNRIATTSRTHIHKHS